jgi:hypothetical protein
MINYVVLVELAFLGLAWWAPLTGDQFCLRIERAARRIAKRERFVVGGTALVALALRLSLLWVIPVPVPEAHDEFAYLLAADTFVHGRLTNPTHPMWLFLDTIHVNQHPTYMSKYPPAQGAVLAVGQILGRPWIGVLLSIMVMCAAITWMLQGWFPPVWAMLGGLLTLLNFAVFNYWTNSYWGGAVAATGGALVLGALPRIFHSRGPRSAVALGLGAAILANSRPLEGLIFCLPVVFVLVRWLWQRHRLRGTFGKLILPAAAVLSLTAVFMGYYNWRGTGNALVFPYVLNERAYFIRPLIVWQSAKPPIHFLNSQFDDYYNHEQFEEYEYAHDHFAHLSLARIRSLAIFYAGVMLPAPLFTLPWLFRDRHVRLLIVQAAISVVGLLVVVPFYEHYAAPLTATAIALVAQGMRHLRLWRFRGKPVGIGLSRSLIILAFAMLPAQAAVKVFEARYNIQGRSLEMPTRARIETRLEATPGKHLILVHYGPQHIIQHEWVYNRADIDGAKVVWARDIPGIDLKPLLDYFRDRTVWLVDADSNPPQLRQLHTSAQCYGYRATQ